MKSKLLTVRAVRGPGRSGRLILRTINPYLRLLSVLIHSERKKKKKPQPAANQNVSQPFTEQSKLHYFSFLREGGGGYSKTFSLCFWAERLLLAAVLEWGGLGSAFLCVSLCPHFPFRFFLFIFSFYVLCVFFFQEVKLWRVSCDTMWLPVRGCSDISVMGSVDAAFIEKIK